MFRCHLELQIPSRERDTEPNFLVIGKHQFDPGFREGDEFQLTEWEVWWKSYTFDVLVTNHKYEVYPASKKVADIVKNQAALEEGLVLLYLFKSISMI